jgi:hypothetical protein
MKNIYCALAGVALAISIPAFAAVGQTPSDAQSNAGAKLLEARAIVETILPPRSREQMMRDLLAKFTEQMTAVMPSDVRKVNDPGLNKIVDDFHAHIPDMVMPIINAHMPQIMSAMATAYIHEFSLPELKEIHAFAATPAGKHYLSRSLAIAGDPVIATANKAYLTDLSAAMRNESAALRDQLDDYFKTHPEIAKKLVAQAATKE